MKLETLRDILIDELRDLYHAETQLVKSLPKMTRAATSPDLKSAFESHLKETRGQVQRLEEAFAALDVAVRGKKCKAMEGLLAEGAEMMKEDADPEVRDVGLISAAQRVEHYEIAAYGCARTYAQLLGERKVAGLLQSSLDEEGATNKKLTLIARHINVVAADKNGEPVTPRKSRKRATSRSRARA